MKNKSKRIGKQMAAAVESFAASASDDAKLGALEAAGRIAAALVVAAARLGASPEEDAIASASTRLAVTMAASLGLVKPKTHAVEPEEFRFASPPVEFQSAVDISSIPWSVIAPAPARQRVERHVGHGESLETVSDRRQLTVAQLYRILNPMRGNLYGLQLHAAAQKWLADVLASGATL